MGQVKQRSQVSIATAYEGIVWLAQCPAAFTTPTDVGYPLRAGWTQGRPRHREQIHAFTWIRTPDHRNASRPPRTLVCNVPGIKHISGEKKRESYPQ